jgi:hypothetical protein
MEPSGQQENARTERVEARVSLINGSRSDRMCPRACGIAPQNCHDRDLSLFLNPP